MFFRKDKGKELKRWQLIFLLLMIVVAIGYKIYGSVWPKGYVTVRGQTIHVLVADTYARRFEGWSNKEDMGKYGGMLFVFPERAQHTMVMRDMGFPLDIVWIDGTTIVDMAPRVIPEPGRGETELTPYFARSSSTHVLELPAGFIEQHGLKVGDTVIISD